MTTVKFGDVSKLTKQYLKRLDYVAKTATQDVYHAAQVSTGKGGRMRVDTGFLRASAQAKLGSMPSGPTTNEGGKRYSEGSQAKGQPVELVLLRWKPEKEALYIGWTANYARWREYQDGFMRGATERWQEFVNAAAKEAKRKKI